MTLATATYASAVLASLATCSALSTAGVARAANGDLDHRNQAREGGRLETVARWSRPQVFLANALGA